MKPRIKLAEEVRKLATDVSIVLREKQLAALYEGISTLINTEACRGNFQCLYVSSNSFYEEDLQKLISEYRVRGYSIDCKFKEIGRRWLTVIDVRWG